MTGPRLGRSLLADVGLTAEATTWSSVTVLGIAPLVSLGERAQRLPDPVENVFACDWSRQVDDPAVLKGVQALRDPSV